MKQNFYLPNKKNSKIVSLFIFLQNHTPTIILTLHLYYSTQINGDATVKAPPKSLMSTKKILISYKYADGLIYLANEKN